MRKCGGKLTLTRAGVHADIVGLLRSRMMARLPPSSEIVHGSDPLEYIANHCRQQTHLPPPAKAITQSMRKPIALISCGLCRLSMNHHHPV